MSFIARYVYTYEEFVFVTETSTEGRKYNLCWAFFNNGVYVNVSLQLLGDGGAQEPECRA